MYTNVYDRNESKSSPWLGVLYLHKVYHFIIKGLKKEFLYFFNIIFIYYSNFQKH